MINHPNPNRKLDIKQYVPIYMHDEELIQLFDVFETALNDLYESASNGTDYDIVTTDIDISKSIIDDDTAPNLFKYPQHVIDPDDTLNVVGDDNSWEWSYNEHKPSQDQLNPIPNYSPVNPVEYPNDTPNPGYLNTSPPQYPNTPILYPDKDGGPYQIQPGFDYRLAKDIQAKSKYEDNERTQSSYEKHGLYDSENLFKGTKKPIPQYTSYTESKTVNHTQAESFSVLEKIYRLIDLKDASMIDMKYLQFFADYLGYDLNLNLDDFGVNLVNIRYGQYYTQIEKEENIEKQVRTMIENLPHWYKIKTTENALKIILYSFGLIADILTYYTKNYSTHRQDWETADKKTVMKRYKSWSDDRYITIEDFKGNPHEGRPEIPDDWYPTPHFEVRYSINESFDWETGSLFYDETSFSMLAKAIDAAKPINTVFEGLAALFQTRDKRMITAYSIVNSVYYQSALATDENGILPIASAGVYYPIMFIINAYIDDPHATDNKTRIEILPDGASYKIKAMIQGGEQSVTFSLFDEFNNVLDSIFTTHREVTFDLVPDQTIGTHSYYIKAYDNISDDISQSVYFTVTNLLHWVQAPIDKYVQEGDALVVTATFAGGIVGTNGYKYELYKFGVLIDEGYKQPGSSTTSYSYTLTQSVDSSYQGNYTLKVYDNTNMIEQAFTITVYEALEWVTEPQDQDNLIACNDITINAEVKGGNTITLPIEYTYNLYKDGTLIHTDTSTNTNYSIVISNSSTDDSGDYKLEVTEGYNTIDSEFTLTVYPQVEWVDAPQDQVVSEGDDTSIDGEVDVCGDDNP